MDQARHPASNPFFLYVSSPRPLLFGAGQGYGHGLLILHVHLSESVGRPYFTHKSAAAVDFDTFNIFMSVGYLMDGGGGAILVL